MGGTTINIDTGGTFTDAFVIREGESCAVKVLTTPHDLAVCFREAIERAAGELGLSAQDLLGETLSVRHATTVGTNAIIQGTGPRLGLLAGAEGELLYDGDGRAQKVFELFLRDDMVAPIDTGGDEAVLEATKALLGRGARGLVCALPGGDREPDAELRTRELFERHYPKHCLDAVPLLLSHEAAADADDFRRTATALFNAYVHAEVARYLYRAEDFLRDSGYNAPLLIVHSSRGVSRVAKTVAGRTYNSGPMAGLIGAEVIARLYGIDRLVTLDMGGTSLDVAFVEGGEAPMRERGSVDGVEISFPLPELVALGAGGGSVAWSDGGTLRVGPRSAGAKPGPACFGFGGSEPTVTDADLVLGVLDPQRFLGGAMTLDREAAERAIGGLASELGREPIDVAADIRSTVHAEMGKAIGGQLAERGIDPAATAILAYGGAGPMHAAGFADAAGVREVITVPFAAVFSAFGASAADVLHEYAEPAGDGVEEELLRRALRDMRGEGFSAEDVRLDAGSVEVDDVTMTHVRAEVRLDHFEFQARPTETAAPEAAGSRAVHWPGSGPAEAAIYAASELRPGHRLDGPSIVEAEDTTHVVPAGWSLAIDEYGNGRLRDER